MTTFRKLDGFAPIFLIFVSFLFLCGIFIDLPLACTDIPAESSFAAGERMSELVKVSVYSLFLYIFYFDAIKQNTLDQCESYDMHDV